MAYAPYAPPVARVSDPAGPALPKPVAVQRAVRCLWASAALTVAMTLLQLTGVLPSASLPQDLISGLASAAVVALVATKIDAGRGWARWLFLVLYIVGSFLFAIWVASAPNEFVGLPVLMQASSALQFLLETLAVLLLFKRASRQWFRAPQADLAPGAVGQS